MVDEAATKRFAESKKAIKNIDYSGAKTSNTGLGKAPEQARQDFENTFFV